MWPKILYIEDNPDNWHLVNRVLKSKGCATVWAPNGLEGLNLVQAEQPDLIILDINLPDIDGYEVVRRLRANFTKKVPVVALTANAMRGDDQKALDAGCDLYMTKPLNIHELWACVSKLLLSGDGGKPKPKE